MNTLLFISDVDFGAFFYILLMALSIVIVIYLLIQIITNPKNNPTWKGIIISLMLGMLPLYLFLCFFGIMGEERDDEELDE